MRRDLSFAFAIGIAVGLLACRVGRSDEQADDWYYPTEEPAQRAALEIPSVRKVGEHHAALARANTGSAVRVNTGGEFQGWRVVETLSEPEPIVVLEREFDRWGLILFLSQGKVIAEVRKAVGRLERICGPRIRFPASYAQGLIASKEDLLARRLLAGRDDASYASVAALLPPLEDPWALQTPHDTYTFIGTPEAPRKLEVGPDGAIGLRFVSHNRQPLLERVLFDSLQRVPKPAGPVAAKRGLLGGFLPAVDYGFFDTQSRFGWEMSALVARGNPPTALARIRRTDGRTTYHQIEPARGLPDGKAFFSALLTLHRSWHQFFDRGMQFEIADRRVADASRASIVRALTSYVGLHPKYGLGAYWRKDAEGFPPQTVSLNTCLLDWGFVGEASDRLGYYLDHFVKPDGTIDYYGTAVSDFGQLLDLAARCVREGADPAWLDAHRGPIDRIVAHLLKLRAEGRQSQPPGAVAHGLLFGAPEADTHKQTDYYFSGSVWAWRGLREIGQLDVDLGRLRNDTQLIERGQRLLDECQAIRVDILRAVDRSIADGFLPPIAGRRKPFEAMWESRLSIYTNFRYWLETTSANCLPAEQERMILDYRLAHGGELLSMTRFDRHLLDDWPYWHQAHSLLCHDRVDRYLVGLFGHLAHHQTQGTFTAFELVYLNGTTSRRIYDDYCVPSQMTVPLMLRWMLAFEDRNSDTLWLCRAVPRAWLKSPIALRGARTRWGPLSLRLDPHDELRRFSGRIELAGNGRPSIMLRLRHPSRLRIAECRVAGGTCVGIDRDRETVCLKPSAQTIDLELTFAVPPSR